MSEVTITPVSILMVILVLLVALAMVSVRALLRIAQDYIRWTRSLPVIRTAEAPAACMRPPLARSVVYAPEDLTLEKQVGEAWVSFATRPPAHHDVAEIRAGLHPGVRIQGE